MPGYAECGFPNSFKKFWFYSKTAYSGTFFRGFRKRHEYDDDSGHVCFDGQISYSGSRTAESTPELLKDRNRNFFCVFKEFNVFPAVFVTYETVNGLERCSGEFCTTLYNSLNKPDSDFRMVSMDDAALAFLFFFRAEPEAEI